MTLEALYCLTTPLILLQVLALGWTVDRQIRTPVAQRQSVVALPDVLNICSLFAVVVLVILTPLVSGSHLLLARAVLGGAYLLLCFYPLTVAAQHRLWRRDSEGTGSFSLAYACREEVALAVISVVVAIGVAVWIERANVVNLFR